MPVLLTSLGEFYV